MNIRVDLRVRCMECERTVIKCAREKGKKGRGMLCNVGLVQKYNEKVND